MKNDGVGSIKSSCDCIRFLIIWWTWLTRMSIFSLTSGRSVFPDFGIACNNRTNKNLLFSWKPYSCFSSSHVFNFCLSLNKCPTHFKTFSETSAKYILSLSILMFLLYHRACDTIAEGKTGVEVQCKHQFFKIIL